jgi:hypothetical protein
MLCAASCEVCARLIAKARMSSTMSHGPSAVTCSWMPVSSALFDSAGAYRGTIHNSTQYQRHNGVAELPPCQVPFPRFNQSSIDAALEQRSSVGGLGVRCFSWMGPTGLFLLTVAVDQCIFKPAEGSLAGAQTTFSNTYTSIRNIVRRHTCCNQEISLIVLQCSVSTSVHLLAAGGPCQGPPTDFDQGRLLPKRTMMPHSTSPCAQHTCYCGRLKQNALSACTHGAHVQHV